LQTKYIASFALSLVAGILLVINGLMSVIMLTSFGVNYGFMAGIMSGYAGMMGTFGVSFGLMMGLMISSIVAGIVVLVGAFMLNSQPSDHFAWGVIIIIFSAISFVSMGGFFIGAILGVAGGALALS